MRMHSHVISQYFIPELVPFTVVVVLAVFKALYKWQALSEGETDETTCSNEAQFELARQNS